MRRALLWLLLIAAAWPASAVRTRTWRESPSELARGDSDGIAISRFGDLSIAPGLAELDTSRLRERPAQLWSLTRDAQGATWIGTGPDGQILRLDRSGQPSVVASLPEPLVTAMAVDGEGLIAAGAPGGRIYRVAQDGTVRLWCETGHAYVWDLAVAPGGRVLAAAGSPAAILRIDRAGNSSALYEAAERHVMSLLPLDDGHVVAGTAPAGRIYRVDPEGRATVLHDDELPEATALHRSADGAIYVGLIAPPEGEPERPSVTINLADGGSDRATTPLDGERVEVDGAELRGVIEGLAAEPARPSRSVRGRVLRIDPDGTVTTVWRSAGAAVLSLFDDGAGNTLFGTGEPARVYRIDGASVTLLHTLPAAQTSAGIGLDGRAIVGASNPLRLFRIDDGGGDEGVYLSRPFDAGSLSRWGSVSWTQEGEGAGRAEIATRTGDSTRPDATWSGWSPALTRPEGSPVINPDGRFVQWRLRITGAELDGPRVRDVTLHYAPHNRPPQLKDLSVEDDATAIDDAAVVRWSAYDPDDDRVEVRFEYRAEGATAWTPLPRAEPEPFADAPRSGWREDRFRWETAGLADGSYELRAFASDRGANAPDEGFEILHERTLRVAVDHRPPSIEFTRSGGGFTVEVRDDGSPLQRVQLVVGERTLYTLRPADGVVDSRQERFELPADRLPAADWSLRAIDAAGNRADSSPEEPR